VTRAIRIALAVIAVGALVLVATHVDRRAALDALRDLDVAVVALAAVVVLAVKLGAKVGRSQRILDDVARAGAPRWPSTARLLVASHAAGQLAWAPLGFTVRTLGLRAIGLPLATIGRVHLHERVAELAALIVLGGAALACAPHVAGPMLRPGATALLGVAIVIAVIALALVCSNQLRSALVELARDRDARRTLARSSTWSLVSGLADLLVLAIAARAAGLDVAALGPAPILLAYLGLNLGCALPVVPAQLGVQEAAIVLALATAGVPPAPALAAALAYRAAHVVPLALIGLPALVSLGLKVQ
jgi:uncharacterized membrane protein YbhN (UPF0104 family)